MLRVCHMTSAHKALDDRIFEKECRSLAKAGHEVYLVASGNSFQKDGIKVIGFKRRKSRIGRILLSGRDAYWQARKINADIYHIHDPELLPYAARLKRQGSHVIYDSHEDVPRQILSKKWIPRIFRRPVSVVFEKYEKKISKKLDCVITATPYIRKIFKRCGCKAEAICNFPILTNRKNKEDYLTRENNLCYVGGITEDRGITNVVRAVEGLELTLYLAGDLDSSYKKELMKEPGWRNVRYLGFLPRSEVEKLYDKCIAGVALLKPTPNYVNAFAIKIFEYMNAGLPVFCSDFPVWKEIVEENQCGVCKNPEQVGAIREQLVFLLENRELFHEFGKRGAALTRKKFNWINEERKLLALYSGIEKYRQEIGRKG